MNRASRMQSRPAWPAPVPEPRTCCRCGGPFVEHSGGRRRIGPCCRPLSRSDHTPAPPKPHNRPGQPLTPRQLQIAALAAEGHPSKEIAFRTGLAYGTVKTVLSHIFIRAQVANRVELARLIWDKERAA